MPLLDVRNLSVSFDTAAGPFFAVQGVDLSVDAGEVLAIVGEFGLGQVGGDAGGDGPAAADRHGHRRRACASRAGTCWR